MNKLLTASASLFLALPAFAQEPVADAAAAPKLDPIVAKMIENLPKLANLQWEASHTLNVDSNDAAVKGTVQFAWQDKKHFKCNLDITANPKAAAVPEGVEPKVQNVKATIVADGTWLWVSSPALTQTGMLPENIKLELALFDEIMKMAPAMMGGMDPTTPAGIEGMVSDATKGFSFKEEGSTEALRRFVFNGGGWTGAMKSDSTTWYPMGLDFSSEEGMKFAMNTTSFSKKETFAEGTFVLSGVDVTTVMDLTPMIRMQLGAMGGNAGGDEDLEF